MTCRDPTLRLEVVGYLKNVFKGNLLSYKIPQEVNEILFCWKFSVTDMKSKINKRHPAIKAFDNINSVLKDKLLDISEAIEKVQIV